MLLIQKDGYAWPKFYRHKQPGVGNYKCKGNFDLILVLRFFNQAVPIT